MSPTEQLKPNPSQPIEHNTHTALHTLNERIDSLGQATLPRQPYLLSVPSDVPYRHSSRFVNTWYVGTPFARNEEQLQYMSFLPHQGDHEELLRVVGGWSDDHGNFLEEEPSPRTVYNTGPSTPADHGGRKKISLKDYQKDKMLPDSEKTPSKPIREKKEPTRTAQSETNGGHTSETESRGRTGKPSRPEPIRSPVRREPKKSVMPQVDGTLNRPPPESEPSQSQRPAKRRKLSASPPPTVSKEDKDAAQRRMPKLLSPTLPSPEHNALPELLSPVLPPSLMKAIATPPSSNGSDSAPLHHRSDSVRSILASAMNDSGHLSAEKTGPQSGTLGSNRQRSDSQHSARSAASTPTATKTLPTSKSGVGATLKPGTSTPVASRSPGPRQRHVIVLKYGKKNRKRIEALLKFPTRAKKADKSTERPESANRDSKLVPPAKEPLKPAIKRDRSPQPHATKPTLLAPDPTKRPTTPLTNGSKAAKSIATPTSKSAFGTPKKELKPTAMRRVESAEGHDPATPEGKCQVVTPASVEPSTRPAKSSPLPSSTLPVSDEERQAWKKLDVEKKYFTLGRQIKHESTAMADKASNEQELRKALLLMVEALLTFMTNLAMQPYLRGRGDPGWSTIIGYYNMVLHRSRRYPHLQGLVLQMGAVCRQQIQKYHLERLARDPLPDDHSGAAPTPGSDGNTKTNEDGEGYKKKYLAFRDELISNSEELQEAWLKASQLLPMELVQKEFPKTWSKRLKDLQKRGAQKPNPRRPSPGYHLPLDPATTPFEAADFGAHLLSELAEKEKTEWKPRFVL